MQFGLHETNLLQLFISVRHQKNKINFKGVGIHSKYKVDGILLYMGSHVTGALAM